MTLKERDRLAMFSRGSGGLMTLTEASHGATSAGSLLRPMLGRKRASAEHHVRDRVKM